MKRKKRVIKEQEIKKPVFNYPNQKEYFAINFWRVYLAMLIVDVFKAQPFSYGWTDDFTWRTEKKKKKVPFVEFEKRGTRKEVPLPPGSKQPELVQPTKFGFEQRFMNYCEVPLSEAKTFAEGLAEQLMVNETHHYSRHKKIYTMDLIVSDKEPVKREIPKLQKEWDGFIDIEKREVNKQKRERRVENKFNQLISQFNAKNHKI